MKCNAVNKNRFWLYWFVLMTMIWVWLVMFRVGQIYDNQIAIMEHLGIDTTEVVQ